MCYRFLLDGWKTWVLLEQETPRAVALFGSGLHLAPMFISLAGALMAILWITIGGWDDK